MFNYRMVFPFEYSETKGKVIVRKKVNCLLYMRSNVGACTTKTKTKFLKNINIKILLIITNILIIFKKTTTTKIFQKNITRVSIR